MILALTGWVNKRNRRPVAVAVEVES
jgi:hypothetical protein